MRGRGRGAMTRGAEEVAAAVDGIAEGLVVDCAAAAAEVEGPV